MIENPRYDDAVLRWLPEIEAASAASGLTPAQVAALVALMSGGEPAVVSPLGAVGLTQVKPDEFGVAGVDEALWYDPATNISLGSAILSEMIANAGSVEGGLASWFGEGCDDSGLCTADYIQTYLALVATYESVLADPTAAGYALLPADWLPTIGVPFTGSVPYRFEPVPPTEEPVIEVPPTEEPTAELPPTEEPTIEVPSEIPTEEIPVEDPPVRGVRVGVFVPAESWRHSFAEPGTSCGRELPSPELDIPRLISIGESTGAMKVLGPPPFQQG